jgi:phage repressor protein C with HTH and peptisase S24 domain
MLDGDPPQLTRRSLDALASTLKCSVSYLIGDADNPEPEQSSAEESGSLLSRQIPLYQPGLSAADGSFSLDDSSKTTVQLVAADGVYAIVVPDDTLAPRYVAGEMVVVNPAKPASRGGYAVVRKADGSALIRFIVGIAPDRITVATHDGSDQVEISRDEIRCLERIIASAEL